MLGWAPHHAPWQAHLHAPVPKKQGCERKPDEGHLSLGSWVHLGEHPRDPHRVSVREESIALGKRLLVRTFHARKADKCRNKGQKRAARLMKIGEKRINCKEAI